mgnify:CR=1 FL=1
MNEKEEDDEDNDKKVSEEGAQGDGKRVTFESDDEEDKEWLAIQERRKQEVIKETRRENATYIPVQEIDKVDRGNFDKKDNPLKNAPHTYVELASTEWKHAYSREEAAFPTEYIKNNKYWAPVARVDNVFGDRNLVCSCPTMDEYKDEAA